MNCERKQFIIHNSSFTIQKMAFFLGIDIGSSSVKVSLVEAETGKTVATAQSPASEMKMSAPQSGWAEQDPEMWWTELKKSLELLAMSHEPSRDSSKLMAQSSKLMAQSCIAIGISYQMHGLVLVDKDQKVLRPSIIWCDSRAVEIGDKAFNALGKKYCLEHYLNAPGNFTASKLRWVMENEPKIWEQTDKMLLPGDYIAMRLTGEACTTVSGLSEGILWDFEKQSLASRLLEEYEIRKEVIPKIVPTFGEQGFLTKSAAAELGLTAGIPITYRAGDQPNNAFSLNVLHPGDVAATAGTSGVIYGVTDKSEYDAQSRVNTFVHVNDGFEQLAMSHEPSRDSHEPLAMSYEPSRDSHEQLAMSYEPSRDSSKLKAQSSKLIARNGVLLCINGTGISNAWLKRNTGGLSYEAMNMEASKVGVGSEGVIMLPFGNGAERIFNNKQLGGQIHGLDFNRHSNAHLFRAAQEGIVFSLNYGLEIMKTVGVEARNIRAGHANMFLSPLFRDIFANTTGATIELLDTDGATGAARGAGVGVGYYKNFKEAFRGLKSIATIAPDAKLQEQYAEVYQKWKRVLEQQI